MAGFHAQIISPPDVNYPGMTIPTIFADGIMNLANSAHIVKFYMFRLDPSVSDVGQARAIPCAQVVLPLDGFINTFAFMQNAVDSLLKQGIITQQALDDAARAAAV